MQVETLWGNIVSRENVFSSQSSSHVLLSENPNLAPLFKWLHIVGLTPEGRCPKSERLTEEIKAVELFTEARFYIDEARAYLVFHAALPMRPDYEKAIREYLNLLYHAMYSPGVWFYVSQPGTGDKVELTVEELAAYVKILRGWRKPLAKHVETTDFILIKTLEDQFLRRIADSVAKKAYQDLGLVEPQ